MHTQPKRYMARNTKWVDRLLNNVLLILVLVLYSSLISTKLNKTTCKIESALSYLSDAYALLAHGALYTTWSWKIQYMSVHPSM